LPFFFLQTGVGYKRCRTAQKKARGGIVCRGSGCSGARVAAKFRGIQAIARRQLEGIPIRHQRHKAEKGEKIESLQATKNEGGVAIIVESFVDSSISGFR